MNIPSLKRLEAGVMSKPLEIPLDGLKKWLEQETVHVVEPLKERGTSLLKSVNSRLSEVREVCERLLVDGEKEMRKGDPKTYRSARAANRLARNILERVEKVVVPDEISYENLQTLCVELEKTLVLVERERREWFPQIEPYFIMDRRRLEATFKKAMELLEELRNFSSRQYVKAKAVEDTFSMIDKLLQLLNALDEVKTDRKRMELRGRDLEKKIAENQRKITLTQNKGEVSELVQINRKIEDLEGKIKHDLRYLQKPFFKLQSLARSADVSLPLDEAKKLSEYLSGPFVALATEEEGYPLLKRILRRVDDAIVRGKLKLKSSRLRKAQEQINSILRKDSLISLHQSCKEAFSQKQDLLSSGSIAAFQNELEQLQKDLRDLQKRKELANSRSVALDNEYKRILEKIENQEKEIENTIFEAAGKKVQISPFFKHSNVTKSIPRH